MGLIGALSVRRLKSERSRANECKEERKGLHYTTLHPAPAAAPRSPADGQSSGVGGRRLVVI